MILFYYKLNISWAQFKVKAFQIEMFIYKLILQGFKSFIQEIKEILFFKSCLELILKQEMIINKLLIFLKRIMVKLVTRLMNKLKTQMESKQAKEIKIKKLKMKSKFLKMSKKKKRNQ